MRSETIDGFCPRCNRIVAAEVRAEAYGSPTEDLFEHLDAGEDGLGTVKYKLAFCPSCAEIFLHRSCTSEPSQIPCQEILYPRQTKLSVAGLPDVVRRAYESASSCFETGNYEPCVIMCRKCLEALSTLLGETKGSLQKRLGRLRDTGTIEAKLYSWANELRLIGNEAAHDLHLHISKGDARDSLEFLEALLLYVFVLDSRFQRFKKRHRGDTGGS